MRDESDEMRQESGPPTPFWREPQSVQVLQEERPRRRWPLTWLLALALLLPSFFPPCGPLWFFNLLTVVPVLATGPGLAIMLVYFSPLWALAISEGVRLIILMLAGFLLECYARERSGERKQGLALEAIGNYILLQSLLAPGLAGIAMLALVLLKGPEALRGDDFYWLPSLFIIILYCQPFDSLVRAVIALTAGLKAFTYGRQLVEHHRAKADPPVRREDRQWPEPWPGPD